MRKLDFCSLNKVVLLKHSLVVNWLDQVSVSVSVGGCTKINCTQRIATYSQHNTKPVHELSKNLFLPR